MVDEGVGMNGEDSAPGGVNGVPPGPGTAGDGTGGGGASEGEEVNRGMSSCGLGRAGGSDVASREVASLTDWITEENMSPADAGVKVGDDGAKLEDGSGGGGGAAEDSENVGSGGFGGAGGSGAG